MRISVFFFLALLSDLGQRAGRAGRRQKTTVIQHGTQVDWKHNNANEKWIRNEVRERIYGRSADQDGGSGEDIEDEHVSSVEGRTRK